MSINRIFRLRKYYNGVLISLLERISIGVYHWQYPTFYFRVGKGCIAWIVLSFAVFGLQVEVNIY